MTSRLHLLLWASLMAIPASRTAADSGVPGRLVFPHIADGGGYRTVFLLTNPTASETVANLAFFSGTGAPLPLAAGDGTSGSLNVTVPARGSAKVTTAGIGPTATTGWALVTTSPAVELNGNAIFQLFKGGGLFSEASVPASAPSAAADFFADEDEGFNTGFALANPGTVTAVGALTLRTRDGSAGGTWPVSLPPRCHTAVFLHQLFDSAPTGRAEIDLTAGAVSVASLRYHASSIFSTVSVGTPAAGANAITALFSPGGGVRARIVNEIAKAASTIDIAIYSFTSNEIREALIGAKNRGVTVRIVADERQATLLGGEIPTLESLGFSVKRMAGLSDGIMHNKYMIIDGNVLVTGSYNWTVSAEDYNYENAVFFVGSPVIQGFVADFDRLWAR